MMLEIISKGFRVRKQKNPASGKSVHYHFLTPMGDYPTSAQEARRGLPAGECGDSRVLADPFRAGGRERVQIHDSVPEERREQVGQPQFPPFWHH